MVVRDELGDLEGTADHVGARPEGIPGQLLGGDAGQAMLRQYRRKQVQELGVDAIEMEREALQVVDIDSRDRRVPVGREDALHLGIDDQPPGEGDIVGSQRLAIRPAQSLPEPVGDVHRAGATVPSHVTVLQCRYALDEVGQRLQVGIEPHQAGVEQGVNLCGRNFFVEEWREIGRALPVPHQQGAALMPRRFGLILRGRRRGGAQRNPVHRRQRGAPHEWQERQGNDRGFKRPPV